MARRIVVAVLALIGTLLITTVIPLGLLTTGRERQSFREETLLSAQAVAAVAEESIAEHRRGPALAMSLARASHSGQYVRVYDGSGELIAGNGGPARLVSPSVLAATLRDGATTVSESHGRLLAVLGLRGGSGGKVAGAVALSRSTARLDGRIRVLWGWLGGLAAAGLLAGAFAAVAFTRWVGRPLLALDAAAQQLGGGALGTRSATGQGPPEVRRLAGNFNTMAGRLEALVHGHRATMADVSHQLRTPLAALRLRLDLLSEDADEATARELADAQGEIARLSRLVDGLLAVARAENAVVEPVQVEVDAVAADRAAAWRPVAADRGVELVTGPPSRVRASLGEGHLEQILDNLLANALEALPPGGRVSISAHTTPHGATVTVADNGPGMTDERQQQAFRRFTSSTPGGAGLGLAIVHRLATANGGSVTLSDTPGGGLTVRLDLPGREPGRGGHPPAPVGPPRKR